MQVTFADLVALVTVVFPFIVAGATALFHLLMGYLPASQQAKAQEVVGQVVLAVEQLYKQLPGSGADKKARALTLAQAILAGLHVTVSSDQLNVLIEAAVASLVPSSSPAPTVPPVASAVIPPALQAVA